MLSQPKNQETLISIREFSQESSYDYNGSVIKSSQITLTKADTLASGDEQESLLARIELAIGAPFLLKQKVTDELCSRLKCRTVPQVADRLDKYRKREIFELKNLQEICSDIDRVYSPSTRTAVDTLNFLYNMGHGRTKKTIVRKLRKAILRRERDKLFYKRRHPNTPMLHKCNDDALLEEIRHLEWMFVGTHPFEKIKRSVHAYSRYV